jgi:hypothetical protein
MDPVVDAILRGSLALLWLSAAVHKLRDLPAFGAAVGDYELVPAAATRAAAGALVAAELATGAALLATPTRAPALLASALLLALYAAAIGVNLLRGRRHLDCGCAGPAQRRPVSGWLVARNALVAAVALAALAPVHARPLAWIDAVTVLAGVCAVAALYTTADHLLALAPAPARSRT